MGPGTEKIRVAGDFILEKSKPKTVVVEQVKPKGIHSKTWSRGGVRGLHLIELRYT